MDQAKNYLKWHLITIDDPAFLPAKSIFDILKLMLQSVNFKFIILDDIVGSSGQNWLMASLEEKENEILKLEEFFDIAANVTQFEWGDFFLFKEYPKNWENTKEIKYPYVIKQTDTTIRAIDGQYIYVYTPSQEIVNIILKEYKIESLSTKMLEELEYPY